MDLLLIFSCVCLLLPHVVFSFDSKADELSAENPKAPWIVGVFKGAEFRCTGALIGTKGSWEYVVTSWKGCGDHADTIIAGAKQSSELITTGSGGAVKVIKIAPQGEKIKWPCTAYDIARLKLATPLKHTEFVYGINLNLQYEPITKHGQMSGFIYSWGFPAGSVSRRLMRAEVTVTQDKCNGENSNKNAHSSPNFHYCVSPKGNPKLCGNDVGGPLVSVTHDKKKFTYLAGILSYDSNNTNCDGDFKHVLIVDVTKFYCFLLDKEKAGISCSTTDVKDNNKCKGSTFSQPLIFLVFLSTLVYYLLARHG